MGAKVDAETQKMPLHMWLYPWLTWAGILIIVGVLVAIFLRPDHRMGVTAIAGLAVIVPVAASVSRLRRVP